MANYVDRDNLLDYTEKLTQKYKTIFATKTDVGSPLVASTVSEMTDHDKIYVYTGSEAGYTAGNWYYWDGTEWQDGGVYNSSALQTDTTLTLPGYAADAKTTGDEITDLKNTSLTLATGNTIKLNQGTDYNTLKTAGNYKCESVADASTMVHSPCPEAHRLFVITSTATARIFQFVIANRSEARIHKRYWSGSSWSDWSRVADYSEIPLLDTSLSTTGKAADAKATGDALNWIYENFASLNSGKTTIIPDGSNYNEIVTPGNYVVKSVVSAQTMINSNDVASPHRLFVMSSTASSRVFQFMIVNNDNVDIYKRFQYDGTHWRAWRKLADDIDVSLASYSTDYESVKAGVLSKKALTSFTSLKTIPASSGANLSFNQGTTYSGIPYSESSWSGRDVLYDVSIESIFSSFKNPYSDLYSFDWETENPPGRGRNGAAVWAGAVCSTYVSWATNRPLHLVVDEMERMLQFKTINGLEDLEVGDVLFQRSTHVALITGFQFSGFEISKINVSEMWRPLFRSVWYTPEEFWSRYYDYGTKENPGPVPFTVGRFADDYKIKTVPDVNIVDDIISQKGDNAHFALGDDVWMYVTDPNTSITVTAPDGTVSTVTYTSLPQKTIDGSTVPVYNFKSVVNSVGLWKLKGNAGTYDSRVTMYSIPGNMTAVQTQSESSYTTTVTVGEHSGCELAGFLLLTMDKSGTSGIYPVPEEAQERGFIGAHGTTYKQFHDVVTQSPFTINTTAKQNNSFFVRVFFETGCGLAFKDSNCIFGPDAG